MKKKTKLVFSKEKCKASLMLSRSWNEHDEKMFNDPKEWYTLADGKTEAEMWNMLNLGTTSSWMVEVVEQ